MVKKKYEWVNGATLEDHSRRKHTILREYIFQYFVVRCQRPQQERFRLAIIDGFAGGGRYQCGTSGSPLIFIDELRHATEAVNTHRIVHNFNMIEIKCLLILNEADRDAIELLKTHVAPLYMDIQQMPNLHLRVEYLNDLFETSYARIKQLLHKGHYRNVLFNIDQYGHSHAAREILLDIMQSYPSAEIFYTFAIEALISFLCKSDPKLLATQLRPLSINGADLDALQDIMNKDRWLGAAERLVFKAFQTCAPFVSPFSIHNPNGWRYWLIHFANSYRARQVYNNILHQNSSDQAHFGRSGLNMLAYDPSHDDGRLYLFDVSGRALAKNQLFEDIPHLISESGETIGVHKFYESIYNMTPAHTDDMHMAIIENPDIQVITPTGGGERRKASTIAINDVLKIKPQRSFFPVFFRGSKTD